MQFFCLQFLHLTALYALLSYDTVSWAVLPETVNYFLLNHEGEKPLTLRIRGGLPKKKYIHIYKQPLSSTYDCYTCLKVSNVRFRLRITISRKILSYTKTDSIQHAYLFWLALLKIILAIAYDIVKRVYTSVKLVVHDRMWFLSQTE